MNSTPNSELICLVKTPATEIIQKSKKGSKREVMSLSNQTHKRVFSISVEHTKGE